MAENDGDKEEYGEANGLPASASSERDQTSPPMRSERPPWATIMVL